MTKLYSELARAYHEMYQSLFDYQEDFEFYHRLLQKYSCRSVVELGCGSGNLASYFLDAGYEYAGVDASKAMLAIAREVAPNATFIQGDMRHLSIDEGFDAAIITGRSIAYLITNQDVMHALGSIYRTLRGKGLLIFDAFDAEGVMLSPTAEFVHTADYQGRKYRRVSRKSLNLQTGWTWNWDADYYIDEPGKPTKVVRDHSVLRAFTEQELKLFLALQHFRVLEVIKDNTLAFVARKTESALPPDALKKRRNLNLARQDQVRVDPSQGE